MEKILRLYTYNGDAVESTPFPNAEEQVVITDFQYDANRMGGSPSISAKIMHRLCLDDLWTDNVYAEFNGEKYFVMNTPSSNKDNDDTRYEHEIELLSEREVLNHIYFIDAVQGDSTVDVYKSNSTKVIFMGDINEFASRLNSSLSYSNVGYNVVVDEGIVTEAKLVSFEDKYIMSALQEIFNIYEVPYYFVGKTIHIGYTDNAIPNVFKYGFEDALLSISKNNANYEVVRRCTGIGSSDNIPYYYPNESDDRAAIEASGKKWITPSQNLMPPIYRETEGAERFYNAVNDTYPSPEGGYYTFENLYSTRTPNEKIVSFEDIKPSIVGMTNASGQRIDQFIDIAFDRNDNDEYDEENNTYVHPYFFVKLPKYNGSFGFNLFDQAIENGAMTISMTNGVCGACSFEIGVGDETQKNIVQVDENGNLKRDENGNVLWENQTPQDRQNDTQNYEVWIALKKDDTTYGQIMPNASQNLRPSVGDTFVILNINLPQSYILAAEERLKDSIIKYMFLNNNERFTFSVNFSRIYFAENPDVLAMMNENARILIEYNGKQHTLYISSFSYKMSSDSPLPEISVELTDELSVGQNSLQNALDQVKNDILSSIGGGDFLKQGLKYFIRKDINDVANGQITFNKGLVSDNVTSKSFTSGPFGSGYTLKRDTKTGKSYMEIDELYVRLKAYFETLEIKHLSHVGGRIVLSPASMECIKVEKINGETDALYDINGDRLYDKINSELYAEVEGQANVYRCYFNTTDGEKTIYNEFAIDDLAQCREFNVKSNISQQVANQYYWRRVVGVGDDYIDLSIADCDVGSLEPKAGDTIVTIGNKTDTNRQHVIFLSSYDDDAPCFKLYSGINSYSMLNKEVTVISPNADKNVFTGKVVIKPGSSGFDNFIDSPDFKGWEQSIVDANNNAMQAQDSANKAESAVGDLNEYIDGAFADGVISSAEAAAIEKYINTVNSTKQEVLATYDKLYANPFLTGSAKTQLAAAKNDFTSKIDDLLAAISAAIYDGKTTTEEKNNVDSKYSLFNTSYAAMSAAIEDANKAIQDKIKELAAQEATDNALAAVESQIAEVTTEAKDDIAKKMGYTDYAQMVLAAQRGETVIKGGHINTDLIEAKTIVTTSLIASAIKTSTLDVNGNFIVDTSGNVTLGGNAVIGGNAVFKGAIETTFVNISESDAIHEGSTGVYSIYKLNKKLNVIAGLCEVKLPIDISYASKRVTIVNDVTIYSRTDQSTHIKADSGMGLYGLPISDNERDGEVYVSELAILTGLVELVAIPVSGKSYVRWFVTNISAAYFGTTINTGASPEPTEYTITGRADPFDAGYIDGTGTRLAGTQDYVIAQPYEGYLFSRWDNGETTPQRLVEWSEDKIITAYFTEAPTEYVTISATVNPSGAGKVTGTGTFEKSNDNVELVATANSGYRFVQWSDGELNYTKLVKKDSNKSFIAYFETYTPSGENIFSFDDDKYRTKGNIEVSLFAGTWTIAKFTDSSQPNLYINYGYLANKIRSGSKYLLHFAIRRSEYGEDMRYSFALGDNDIDNPKTFNLIGDSEHFMAIKTATTDVVNYDITFTAYFTSTTKTHMIFAFEAKPSTAITILGLSLTEIIE